MCQKNSVLQNPLRGFKPSERNVLGYSHDTSVEQKSPGKLFLVMFGRGLPTVVQFSSQPQSFPQWPHFVLVT